MTKNPAWLVLLFCAAIAAVQAAPTHLVEQAPVAISEPRRGVYLVDFGRVAFGNIRLNAPSGRKHTATVHFGEALRKGRVDRRPPGTVRYNKARVRLGGGEPVIAAPRADRRNTEQDEEDHPPAILTPEEWGVVLPFRWVEIHGWRGELRPEHIVRRAAFASNWDDDAASFESSDEMLNRIWDLSRYSIKATTFAGVYVDGDRERIPYEADAYLNQLSHYYTDNDVQMARDTFDHLMQHGTWPTEWAPHMVFMAYADWMHTGETQWLAQRFDLLKTKLLLERAGADGLITSDKQHMDKGDIVDWPPGERDGYVFTRVNTVVNAFHLRAVHLMSEMARALDRTEEAEHFEAVFTGTHANFQQALYTTERGLYRDGTDTQHESLHANLFPLAFDLAPQSQRTDMADWLARRGMACSVYAAQYLLEGLFKNGADQEALALMTAPGDRSWRHMVESGATITWEAWDMKYKPNQDWNHAWGAAPANLLPRYVLGVEPEQAGWRTARIRPNTGLLEFARGKVPTPLGAVQIQWRNDKAFTMSIEIPQGMEALIELPAPDGNAGVELNGAPVASTRVENRLVVTKPVTGNAALKVVPQSG